MYKTRETSVFQAPKTYLVREISNSIEQQNRKAKEKLTVARIIYGIHTMASLLRTSSS